MSQVKLIKVRVISEKSQGKVRARAGQGQRAGAHESEDENWQQLSDRRRPEPPKGDSVSTCHRRQCGEHREQDDQLALAPWLATRTAEGCSLGERETSRVMRATLLLRQAGQTCCERASDAKADRIGEAELTVRDRRMLRDWPPRQMRDSVNFAAWSRLTRRLGIRPGDIARADRTWRWGGRCERADRTPARSPTADRAKR